MEDIRQKLNSLIKNDDNNGINDILNKDYKILNQVREDMMLPLNLAILYSKDETVKNLLMKGADPEITDSDGLNSFYNIVWNNRKDLLNIFLKISKNYINEMINLSANKGYTKISAVLLDNGAYLDQWRIDDLFYLSCLRGESENLLTFVNNHSSLNYEKDQVNVITAALRNKHKNVLIELVNLGCDDIGDETPRQIIDKDKWFSAIKNEDYDLVRHYIAKYGRSSVYAIIEKNKNSLDLACEKNNFKLFNILYNVVKPLSVKKKKELEKKAIVFKNYDILNLLNRKNIA